MLTLVPRLEEELQGELNYPRRHRAAGDPAEGGRTTKVLSRLIELWMVPDVVELRSEFDVGSLGYFRLLDKGHVPVVLPGPTDDADAGVSKTRPSKRAGTIALNGASDAGRRDESGAVDPALTAL